MGVEKRYSKQLFQEASVEPQQQEGFADAREDELARAAAAFEQSEAPMDLAAVQDLIREHDERVQPAEEKVAPGFMKYLTRAWEYLRGVLKVEQATITDNGEKVLRGFEEVGDGKDARRKLFHLAEKLFSDDIGEIRYAEEFLPGEVLHVHNNEYVVKEILGRGGYGVALLVEDGFKDAGEHPQQSVIKVSAPFPRGAMFFDPALAFDEDDLSKMKGKAFRARKMISEIGALHKLTRAEIRRKNAMLDANDPARKEIARSEDNNPPVSILYEAELVPHPDNRDSRIALSVMEYIQGDDLLGHIKNEGLDRGGNEFVYSTAIQLLEGLQWMHKKGVLHLDIKPENIRILPNGKVIYIDMGLAVDVDRAEQQKDVANVSYAQEVDKRVYGTPGYVVTGDPMGPARDVYALGQTIADLIYGRDGKNSDQMIYMFKELSSELQRVARASQRMRNSDPKSRITIEQALAHIQDNDPLPDV